MCIHHKAADILRTALQFAKCQGSVMQRLYRVIAMLVLFRIRAYHIKVILRLYHRCKIGLCRLIPFLADISPPVGHYHTFKAPLLPQDIGNQIVVTGGPDAIHRSIGCHDCICLCFLHCNFKSS